MCLSSCTFLLVCHFNRRDLQNSAPTIRVCIGSAVGHISLLSDASEELLCEALEASFSLQKFRLLRLLGRVKHAVSAKAVIQEKVGQDPEKFSIRTMATGSIDDFHIGLRDRIGSPNLDFFKAMRAEHMTRGGHNFTFITRNYELTTQACREWLYVVGDENGNRIEPPASSMGSGRVIHSIDMLLQKPLAQAAKLIREEMIAIVMYTGPAFVLYNAVLRQFPHDIYTVFKDADNLFPTTIFVLVSAVNKLSRCMNIPPSTLLYRGLGGTLEFPDRFSQPDHKCMTPNALGFLEYGFMSTTANKSIAVQYSGVQQGTPKATILQIRPNTVDRGADISQFSQYPLEREFLFAPYSFVQSDGPQRTEVTDGGGVLTAVPVRVNVNLKSETVEELKEKKKQLHLSSAHAIVEEVRHELWEWAASSEAQDRLQEDHSYLRTDAGEAMTTFTLAAEIVRQCEAVTARHLQAPLGDYVDDGSYRALVNEILDIKAWAKEAKELWMLDMSQQIVELQGDEDPPKPLRQCHRLWQTYLRRILDEVAPLPEKQASLSVKLLISRGLVKRGVHGPEEMNADGEDVLVQAGGDGWPTSDIVAAVAAGADVFAADAKGCSGLWNSAQYGHVGTMAALIAAKCNPNQCSHDDVSPIWIAAQDGHAECLALLIEAKGDVNKRHDKGASPAYIAAQEGRLACLKMLVDAGCDINKSDHNGMSPIVIASCCGHADCVSLLLASGARDTRKALSIAYSQGQTECARILEEAAGK